MSGARFAEASVRAATSTAGQSRKPPARRSEVSSERTSCSRSASPAQAERRASSCSAGGRSRIICSTSSTRRHRSESIRRHPGQFPVKPGLCRSPLALDRDGRKAERFGGLFHTQAAEEPHFDDPHLTRVDPLQSVQSAIKCYQIDVLVRSEEHTSELQS